MEHESFENEETAQIMNKYFVNIKGTSVSLFLLVTTRCSYLVYL